MRKSGKTDVWMPFYIGDYLGDTMHLSTCEHGAYFLLLIHYWRKGPLPHDDVVLASIVKADMTQWNGGMGTRVKAFFTLEKDGLMHQKRIDMERARADGINAKRAASANEMWEQKRRREAGIQDANADANASAGADAKPPANGLQTALPSQSQSPLPRKKDSEASPLAGPPADVTVLHDIRTVLWSEGTTILRAITGKSESACRKFLGTVLAKAHDDCAAALAVLREARDLRPVDPGAWIIAAIQARDDPHARLLKAVGLEPDKIIDGTAEQIPGTALEMRR